jgi:hypothetical protein
MKYAIRTSHTSSVVCRAPDTRQQLDWITI